MPRHVLTGTPGSGKTAVLRRLEVDGHRVVEEAATDVIALRQAEGCAQPWQDDGFIDRVLELQARRERPADAFFDRSPVCTLALSRFLGRPPTPLLTAELDRVVTAGVYHRTVFFVRTQGFVVPTAARRISYQDAVEFERVHERAYRELGFDLVEVPPGPVAERAALVVAAAGGALTPHRSG